MANNTLLAFDTFASGSLAAGWSAVPSMSKCQVVVGSPNVTEPNVTGTGAGQIWTGLTWPNDQTSEVTLQGLTGTMSDTVGLFVRESNSAQSGYLAVFNAAGSLVVYKLVSGAATQLGATVTGLTYAAGDVLTFQAAGCALTVFKNGIRIYHNYDLTYTSGFPGYDQNSETTVTNSQVSSWRGYNCIQQDGIWQKQGIVLTPIATDLSQTTAGIGIQIWNVISDGGLFKTWIVSDWSNDAASSMWFASSPDGITWTRGGSAVLTGVTNGAVTKVGSTYYMYGQASGSTGSGNMLVYTSPDGLAWTKQTPSTVLTLANAGSWLTQGFYNITGVVVVNGTWYGYYIGANASGVFSTGVATSPDGINWTSQSTAAPVISGALRSGAPINVGGTWYMWCSAGIPGQGGTALDPFEVVRYQSTDLLHWTKSSNSFHHSQIFESLNANTGGITWGGGALDVNGKAYLWLNSSHGDAIGAPDIGQISLAIGPSTIENIVKFSETASVQVAADGFTSGIGNLGSAWSNVTGFSPLQIVAGNLVEATVINTVCLAGYIGASFSADQYSEITIPTMGSGVFMNPVVRMSLTAETFYSFNLVGPLGTLASKLNIQKFVSGVLTNITPVNSVSVTPQAGDVWRLEVVGSVNPVLSVYQNGFLITQWTDTSGSPITSGVPGMLIFTPTLANGQISEWAGGNAGVIPTYSVGWSPVDSREFGAFPNFPVLQNSGAQFYIGQTSDNPAVPGKNSNPALPPTDSRAAGAPQNSRIAPPF